MKPRILVVEDDPPMAHLIKRLLQAEGYQVSVACDADSALASIKREAPNLLILDIGLPGFSGRQLCQHLKRQPATAGLPIILLTSMAAERQKVEGLDAGADDYITKPFSEPEVKARIRALLRRVERSGMPENVLKADGLELNRDTRTVLVQGREVRLRLKEFELLALFLEKKGRVLSREFLAEAVWGGDALATSHTVSVSVAGLRGKLGTLGRYIIPVVGIGYKFQDE